MSNTFEFEPMAGHILVETITFVALSAGQTELKAPAHYENIEDLEGMVAMGMEEGAVEGHARLAELTENN